MTSREIIIRLIDTRKINGEEAFTLIQDLKETSVNVPSCWNWSSEPYTTTTTGDTWMYTDNSISNEEKK